MELTKLAEAIHQLGRPKHGFSLLIYGDPKTGKTQLAATIAKVKQIKKVFLIDLENGHETLLTMLRSGKLTQEEAAKINVIVCQDTPQQPIGGETVLRLLTSHRDWKVCDEHGRCDCGQPFCKAAGGTTFNISTLGHNDVVILDSGTALTNSVLNYHLRGKDRDYKPGWDEFGPLARDLSNVLTIIQACKTNFIVLTHRLVVDRDLTMMKDGKTVNVTVEESYPSIGTKNFSMSCAKYFSNVIYMHMENNQHKAGSSTTYRYRTIAGSRGGWQIERNKVLDLSTIFDQLYKQKETSEDSGDFKAIEQPR